MFCTDQAAPQFPTLLPNMISPPIINGHRPCPTRAAGKGPFPLRLPSILLLLFVLLSLLLVRFLSKSPLGESSRGLARCACFNRIPAHHPKRLTPSLRFTAKHRHCHHTRSPIISRRSAHYYYSCYCRCCSCCSLCSWFASCPRARSHKARVSPFATLSRASSPPTTLERLRHHSRTTRTHHFPHHLPTDPLTAALPPAALAPAALFAHGSLPVHEPARPRLA